MDCDLTHFLQQSVVAAVDRQTPLQIVGGNSKSFFGRVPQGKVLSLKEHRGVINYQPSELVITARSGTSLVEIEQLLAAERQMLAFEPPHFSNNATLGGAVACGLSGPRRPFAGSIRDFVLGCKIINGNGQVLKFGGEVMKNVAGYDVSRLMVGAMGTLGVLLEISLKVLPLPSFECSVAFEADIQTALQRMPKLARGKFPVSGLCHDDGRLMTRLSGSEKSVLTAIKHLGGELIDDSAQYWQDLCEQKSRFFAQAGDLWRLSVPPATPQLALTGEWLYDWGGAQRWLKTGEPAESIFQNAQQAGGHALLFRGKDRSGEVFHPLADKLRQLNGNLKQAFDPAAIFNRNRLHKAW